MRSRIIAIPIVAALGAMTAGSSAPAAEPAKPDKEGWIALFDAKKGLEGWHADRKEGSHWQATEDGLLYNAQSGGANLLSDMQSMDHELHVEFKVPPNGNSGVYIQGRYEVQVGDSSRLKEPHKSMCGAIYSRIAPATIVPGQNPNEWQAFDIQFRSARLGDDGKVARKARITVVHTTALNTEKPNRVVIIDNAELEGPTGGAVDEKEGTPGPLKLQGDHTVVWYRNIKHRPITK